MKLPFLFCIIIIGNVIHCTPEPEAIALIGRIRGSVLTSRRFIPSFRCEIRRATHRRTTFSDPTSWTFVKLIVSLQPCKQRRLSACFLLREYLWDTGGNNSYNLLTIQVAVSAADWKDEFLTQKQRSFMSKSRWFRTNRFPKTACV
ncbi:uncharacterized protein LOC122535975 [Frieseomelitta varia]|uniref:uncharacterized protein LOC122535975 n=1 Tax=Frieseomelitta varia TaxID=561572 RepID=UPI001CB6B140|nr:uncharacterized protein LOC122535975 [Frieseomelitta varia]